MKNIFIAGLVLSVALSASAESAAEIGSVRLKGCLGYCGSEKLRVAIDHSVDRVLASQEQNGYIKGEANAIRHGGNVDRRPLLVNEDCWHYFEAAGAAFSDGKDSGFAQAPFSPFNPSYTITREGLESYIDDLSVGGKITHFLMNVNSSKAWFPSKVLEPVWTALECEDVRRCGWMALLRDLYAAGEDPYRIWIDRCRARGVKPWISIRMNDVHVYTDPKCGFVAKFLREHPEYRVDPTRVWDGSEGNGWFDARLRRGAAIEEGLDFSRPEVSERMLAFIEETLARYDADGFELDYIRGTRYLTRGQERSKSQVLTDFMRQVRARFRAAERRLGHPVTLAVRLLPSPADSSERGIDADMWAREDLVDVVIPCNFYDCSRPDVKVDEWRAWLGTTVKVIPGTDFSDVTADGRWRQLSYSEYVDWAGKMNRRNPDGLYLFNIFCLKKETWDNLRLKGLDETWLTAGGGEDGEGRVRVSLGGKVRAKMDTFLAARVFGPEAKGRIYEEAVNAFRTHYDDVRTPEQDAVRGWKAGKGLWQGEYWGKSMLAAVSVAEHAGDAELKAWLKEKALAFVKEFQRQDGYLGSYKDPHFVGGPVAGKPGEEIFCWNLWGRKYTMWALLEISRITETPELLDAARKVMDQWMAQLAEKNIRIENTGYFVGLPSMSVLKPLLLLHRATDDEKYLAYADSIVAAWERRGNPAPNLIANAFGGKLVSEWYANPGWWAKAYEMMSCLEGLVAYSQVRRQPRVLEAVERIVAKLEEGELNAVGGVGFFDHFTHAAACPNATTEPCDVTHWIRVNRELFLVTGKAHYLDNIEFAFYNAFLAGVYRDGKWGAHSVRSHGTRHLTAPHQVGMKYHQCCIDNMPRTFVDFAQTVLSRGKDGCLSVNLYSDAKGSCGDDTVEISGGYPFGDVVTIRVSAARKGSVRLRRPSWFDAMAVNGTDVKGDWFVSSLEKGENRFTLSFARSARVVDARPCCSGGDVRADGFEVVNENPEMKGRARKTPAARLVYGPLLLAKAKCLGDAEEEILDFATVNGRGYSCRLKPLEAQGVDGAWTATFTKGSESFSVKVCDFATAADSDDPSNLFSIWF